jgi:zinc transport system ATP-binding protein
MENGIAVTMENVDFSYDGIPVLENVNITVEQKDFLAIIGPNGGGKTTMLKLILGVLEPKRGTIRIFGRKPKLARQFVGYLPQIFTFDFDFPIDVMEVVLMGRLGRRGIGRRYTEADTKAGVDALRKVGMQDFKDSEIGKLSGGQRQRVFIARALVSEPKLLLLDEPVASVDTQWQQSFYELLYELNKEISIIMVTHDISVVSTYIDKIACVNRKLYYHGSKKEGMHKIAELYECPVQLISHSISHGMTENND